MLEEWSNCWHLCVCKKLRSDEVIEGTFLKVLFFLFQFHDLITLAIMAKCKIRNRARSVNWKWNNRCQYLFFFLHCWRSLEPWLTWNMYKTFCKFYKFECPGDFFAVFFFKEKKRCPAKVHYIRLGHRSKKVN